VIGAGLSALPSPHLRLLCVEKCNLYCSYCHFQASQKDGGMMDVAVATGSLRAFVAAAGARGHTTAHVSLYGGEPLLNQPVLQAVLDEAATLRAGGFELTPILNTNGTLLTREKAELLAAAGARVHISLDGPSEPSNAARVNRAGRPSLPATTAAIGHLRGAGCTFQINSMLTPHNVDHLKPLVDFAHEHGCSQMFLALPDASCTPIEELPVDDYAERLLATSAWAAHRNIGFFGPWAVGLHSTSRQAPWPPLNLAVKWDGQVFFPQLPHRLLPSVEEAFASDASAALESEWLETLATCRGCELLEGCNGYLKMMVRYHTQSLNAAPMECDLARKVTLASREPRFATFVTPLELSVRLCDGGFEIENSSAVGSTLIVSRDVLEILNWFREGGSFAALEQAFVAPNMRELFDALVERRLLVEAHANDDLAFLAQLMGDAEGERIDSLILGAQNQADAARLKSLVPQLQAGIERLPARLRPANARFCVFGTDNANGMASILGRDPADPVLEWMAGTVSHSVILLNLARCASVMAHNGKRRTEEFVQQLTHECAHLALRRIGVRLPLWLEEGLCEFIAGANPDAARLALAVPHAREFVRFVLDDRDGAAKTRSLLQFSDAPVDENPAYLLAHDFVAYLDRVVGFDSFLDQAQAAGLSATATGFPMPESRDDLLRLPAKDVLAAWMADLAGRESERPRFEKPLRVLLAGADRAVVYNRMVGGLAVVDGCTAGQVAHLLDRNVSLDEVSDLLERADGDARETSHWDTGFTPRRGYHLRLTLEETCNMGCAYCFEGTQPRRPMSIEVADSAVAAWRDLLGAGDLPHSSIRFFGGEPFLNWPLMKHVLDTATRGLPADAIKWTVNTNGTLLRTEHIDALREKGEQLVVVLSCDGIGAANDAARQFRDGRGTFERVDRAARALCEAGIRVCIATVVGEHNAEGLPDLVRYVAELRRQYRAPIYLSLEPMIGPAFPAEVAAKVERSFFEAVDVCRHESLPVSGKMFQAIESLFRTGGATGHFCAITGNELSVTPDGTLRLCHAIPDSDYADLADVSRSNSIPLPSEIRQRTAGNIESCRGCEVEGLCGGGCAAQSVRNSGSTFGNPGALFCNTMIKVFKETVRTINAPAT
jgi:uncharacterized protein